VNKSEHNCNQRCSPKKGSGGWKKVGDQMNHKLIIVVKNTTKNLP